MARNHPVWLWEFAHSSPRGGLRAPTAAHPSTSPIIVSGQLTLRAIRGRNGPFTVGRLTTHLGVFKVKDAELEQYPEGKYDGEFVIRYIYPRDRKSTSLNSSH